MSVGNVKPRPVDIHISYLGCDAGSRSGEMILTFRKIEVSWGIGGKKIILSDNPMVLPCRAEENWD